MSDADARIKDFRPHATRTNGWPSAIGRESVDAGEWYINPDDVICERGEPQDVHILRFDPQRWRDALRLCRRFNDTRASGLVAERAAKDWASLAEEERANLSALEAEAK
jgi:hypothetical protein